MKKTIIIFSILALVVLIGAGLFFFFRDDAIFDVFYSKDQWETRALNRMAKIYPKTLGQFTLKEPVELDSTDCNQLQTNGEEVCARMARGRYYDKTDRVIIVSMTQIVKGREAAEKFLYDRATLFGSDTLYGYNIMRYEKHEIGWFPKNDSKTTVILTQEGVFAMDSVNGVELFHYPNKATGDNPVTKYFLSKYPPVEN